MQPISGFETLRRGIHSAGLLMCSLKDDILYYFLVHPGGPYWKNKQKGAWSIPKGLPNADESMEEAAIREFSEETSIAAVPPFHPLGSVQLKSRKIVHAWCFMSEWKEDVNINSNMITIEWPSGSGKKIQIPETDRGEWMDFEKASLMINAAQVPFLERARGIFQQPLEVTIQEH